ncbi:MAG: PAS domain S-box protein, partial [Bacillota bacterium]
EVIAIEDCAKSELIPKEHVKELGLKACIAIPIKFDSSVLGVLRLDNLERGVNFSEADIELFLMISEQLGVVIQNARLFAEQKHIEEELRKSEGLYRAIFESTGTASLIVEEDATVVLVNAEFEKLSGYKSCELVGKRKWTEFVFSEDLERMKLNHDLRRLKPEEASSRYEIRLKNRSGRVGYFINNVSVIPGTTRSIASLIEITERRRAEEELRKFSYTVENTPVSVMITDPEGKIEYVNPYCLKVTGYCAQEVIGQNPRFLKSGETPAEEYTKLWNTIKSGRQWKGEFHNKKKSGELYWEIVSISPIKNGKGEIIHFIAIREDITEWKEIERELKASKEKAEASDRLKSEFLAQMSHEIRTPINTILSYSSLIRSELEGIVNDEMKFCFGNIASAGERIIRTIDLILNMSELQTGSYEYSPRQFDLYTDVLEKICSNLLQPAREKNLELILNKNTSETYVTADEYSVSQIIINLVDNAIKYTVKGSVSVSISRNSSSLLAVEVADTGIGIDSEFLPHLFTPFSQEEQGYTRRFEGNGLGLALVKKYCEINNLQIEVQTKKHCGTTFTVLFPLSVSKVPSEC